MCSNEKWIYVTMVVNVLEIGASYTYKSMLQGDDKAAYQRG